MPGKFIKIRHDDNIAVLTLNRPEAKNSLNRTMLESIAGAISRLRDDDTVRGIVITGAGNSFCAGADISEMLSMTPLEASRYAENGQGVMFSLESIGKPVIAAVNGYALGGGLELALACDFIIAGRSASFAAPEIHLGIIPGFGGTQRLPRLVGKSRAKELIFSGKRINAECACSIGLVTAVYDDNKLLPEAVDLTKKICSRGRLSLRLAKEIIDAGSDIDLRNACLMEREAFAVCFASEDQKEGMTAFLEKRAALFQGR